VLHIVTGKISAFKTKLGSIFLKNSAVLDFTSNTGNRLIGVRSSAAGTFIPISHISHTDAAVHTAGSYKRKFIQGFHRQPLFIIYQGL
jgi:hypothetical protein